MKKLLIFCLTLMLISSVVFASTNSFTDTQNHWAKETINWAVEKQMAKGYPDGTFKPNAYVAEAEFLAMLIRAYEGEKEASASHWAEGYYQFAKQMNYPTNGFSDLAKRSWLMTRGQVAEIVAGTQGYNYAGNDAIHFLLLNGLAKGKNPAELTIASFEGEQTLTRAEALQFIKNVLENGVESIQARPAAASPKLPAIGIHDRIIPLKEVPITGEKPNPIPVNPNPVQPKPEQPKPNQPEQPKNPLFDKEDNSPETINKRMEEALKELPEFGITKEHIDTWGWEMYRLGKQAEMVNGKLRLYYPEIPADKADRWFVWVEIHNQGKRDRFKYGENCGMTFLTGKGLVSNCTSTVVPAYQDFDIVGDDYYFSISLHQQGELSSKSFASVGYDNVVHAISVNSRSIEWNHKK